jgi:chlorite dismutase
MSEQQNGAAVGRPYGTGRVPMPEIDRSDQEEIGKGQFVQYAFYKLDPAWRMVPADERARQQEQLLSTLAGFEGEVDIRSYSLIGMRADADLLLWNVAADLDAFQRLGTALYGTALGAYLRPSYSYLAVTKRSIYTSRRAASVSPGARLRMKPLGAKYLFVYPFVKTRPWYKLTFSARQGMMDEHIKIGHKYPSVRLNTTYSFGLDDQEFVVAFETDEPRDFVDLVQELRETEASMYTLRDTPIFSCVALSLPEALATLSGVSAATPLESAVSR